MVLKHDWVEYGILLLCAWGDQVLSYWIQSYELSPPSLAPVNNPGNTTGSTVTLYRLGT
jgi:membrane glycosyltransferase